MPAVVHMVVPDSLVRTHTVQRHELCGSNVACTCAFSRGKIRGSQGLVQLADQAERGRLYVHRPPSFLNSHPINTLENSRLWLLVHLVLGSGAPPGRVPDFLCMGQDSAGYP